MTMTATITKTTVAPKSQRMLIADMSVRYPDATREKQSSGGAGPSQISAALLQ